MNFANMLLRTPRMTRVTISPRADANGVAMLSVTAKISDCSASARRRELTWVDLESPTEHDQRAHKAPKHSATQARREHAHA
jgi:hypothetical protein